MSDEWATQCDQSGCCSLLVSSNFRKFKTSVFQGKNKCYHQRSSPKEGDILDLGISCFNGWDWELFKTLPPISGFLITNISRSMSLLVLNAQQRFFKCAVAGAAMGHQKPPGFITGSMETNPPWKLIIWYHLIFFASGVLPCNKSSNQIISRYFFENISISFHSEKFLGS